MDMAISQLKGGIWLQTDLFFYFLVSLFIDKINLLTVDVTPNCF